MREREVDLRRNAGVEWRETYPIKSLDMMIELLSSPGSGKKKSQFPRASQKRFMTKGS